MTRPEEIIRDINQPNPDRSHIYNELRQDLQNGPRPARQELSQINHGANLANLGFAPDSELLGAINGHYEVRRNGHVELRDAQTGRMDGVEGVRQVNTNLHREFTQRPDGSSYYTVQRGDNLSQIAEAALQDRLGRRPTGAEIYGLVPQIEAANGMRHNETYHPGQTLVIPRTDRQPSAAPEQPTSRQADQPAPVREPEQPQRNLDAVQIPGFPAGRLGQTVEDQEGATASRRRLDAQSHADGGNTYTYDGYVADGHWRGNRTTFNAQETTNGRGDVVERDVTYNGWIGSRGIPVQVHTENEGNVNLPDVTRVRQRLNEQTGEMHTDYYLEGATAPRHTITDRDGRIRFTN